MYQVGHYGEFIVWGYSARKQELKKKEEKGIKMLKKNGIDYFSITAALTV